MSACGPMACALWRNLTGRLESPFARGGLSLSLSALGGLVAEEVIAVRWRGKAFVGYYFYSSSLEVISMISLLWNDRPLKAEDASRKSAERRGLGPSSARPSGRIVYWPWNKAPLPCTSYLWVGTTGFLLASAALPSECVNSVGREREREREREGKPT